MMEGRAVAVTVSSHPASVEDWASSAGVGTLATGPRGPHPPMWAETPAPGTRRGCPLPTRPLLHLQIVLNCRTQVQGRDYLGYQLVFFLFAIFIILGLPMPLMYVRLWFFWKWNTLSSDFNNLRDPHLVNCNPFHFLPQKLSNVSVSPLLRLAICCI